MHESCFSLDFALRSCRGEGGFNKTHALLFHSLSLSSEGCDFTLHAEICRLIQRQSRRAPGEMSLLCGISVYMHRCVFCVRAHTSVIMGNPRIKKEMQQTRVKRGLCFLKYLGNSSDTEVTMVSMVANWNGDEWGGRVEKNVKRGERGGGGGGR